MLDIISNTIKPYKLYKPTKFFEYVRGHYIHDSELHGTLVLYEKNKNPITINNFEFHVRIPNGWYPLKNGFLPAEDNQGFFKLYDKKIKWQDMPLSTQIGYRGGMILWTKLYSEPLYYS